jgi:hypothetical protein
MKSLNVICTCESLIVYEGVPYLAHPQESVGIDDPEAGQIFLSRFHLKNQFYLSIYYCFILH